MTAAEKHRYEKESILRALAPARQSHSRTAENRSHRMKLEPALKHFSPKGMHISDSVNKTGVQNNA